MKIRQALISLSNKNGALDFAAGLVAHGVTLLSTGGTARMLRDAGLPVTEYTAGQVKQAVVGRGRARKPRVQAMVTRLLSLPGEPQEDAADALATAICHAHAATGVGMLARGRYRVRGGRMLHT